DSGIGMSRDFADKAFTSFSRERSSTESGLVGSGLGLAITKRIVDAMNGTNGIETAPGKGCTFTILLEFPAVVRIARVKPREEDAPPPFAGKRLLLVDDIEINREIAQVLLENIGFTVDCAEDGAEAVEKVKASDGAYDCIVMDIQMPVMDGYEATQAIRSLPDPRLSSVPVAALTANSLDEDVQTAMNAGMDAHIAKPLDPDVLVATLAKLLNVAPVA
ncbi:MAG: response regulator, partial [Desulfovibrio sp.]|nr:response regulator [Desulfovibrio sp.]